MSTIAHSDALAGRLVAAIQAGDVPGLRQLLVDNPASARARIEDAGGVTRSLLHIATDWPGHFPNAGGIIRTLADAGADPDARLGKPDSEEVGETPLHWAASCDDVEALEALLVVGADIEAPGAVFTGGTPMSDAVVFAQWEAARRLLERGAQTTLWQAAALGLTDRLRVTLADESETSEREITNAFWHAARAGQGETAAALLACGADLNWVGHEGKTPLDAAVTTGAADMAMWLRSRGARTAADLV